MKKVFIILLALIMVLSLSACSQNKTTTVAENSNATVAVTKQAQSIKTATAPIQPQNIVEREGEAVGYSTVSMKAPPTTEQAKYDCSVAVVRAVATSSQNHIYVDETDRVNVVTLYEFFIEEVFSGDLCPGDTIKIARSGGHMPYEDYFKDYTLQKFPDAKMDNDLVGTEVWFSTQMGREPYQVGEELIIYLEAVDNQSVIDYSSSVMGVDDVNFTFSELWGMKRLEWADNSNKSVYPRTAYLGENEADSAVFVPSETIEEGCAEQLEEGYRQPMTLIQYRQRIAEDVKNK